ncbi:uncharacterized protein LOC121240822 [Juglans microcarpa x Juglans regia]|uniref:uncharacterized protein LOC121240822 n=1 Tax=Juglans microcarpa x Juglans regia TaxID=2249226 RepID=UPI001B7F7359|nr:uncharacterized protein LOC121240822 [Juglans microcarpa x Juglans regia]
MDSPEGKEVNDASGESWRRYGGTELEEEAFEWEREVLRAAILDVNIPLRQPKHVEGEVFVQFTKEELDRSAVPFRFSLVLKFLRQRPSLDRIREANELKDGSTKGVVSLDAEIDKGETEIDREEAEPLVHEKDLTMLAESSGAQSDRELDLVMGDDQVLQPVVVSAMEGLEDYSKSEDEAELAHPAKEKDGSSDSKLSKKKVDVVGGSDQFISLMINSTILISAVYAKCRYLDRRVLWEDLLSVNTMQLPHVILADFNILRNDSEWHGGCPRLLMAMEEFCSFIDTGGLVEMSFLGNKFSWCNGQSGMARSWAQLDRPLCNLKFLELFPLVHNHYLPRYGPSSFKFHFMWTTHEDFWRCVSSSWEGGVYGTGLWKLAEKLKRLKQGETSSSFFKALQSRKHNVVMEMKISDGRVLSSPEAIHEEACVYFEEFIKPNQSSSLPNLADLISSEVSEEENNIFGCPPLMEEVKKALFYIPNDSSPGPDGFGSRFYQHCWSLVKEDVFEAITDFFSGIELPRFYTASYIILLPKI